MFGGGYDYRSTVSVWFRAIFLLQPNPALMLKAPLVYQVHASLAWLLSCTSCGRSAPSCTSGATRVQYLERAWMPYRRRFATP